MIQEQELIDKRVAEMAIEFQGKCHDYCMVCIKEDNDYLPDYAYQKEFWIFAKMAELQLRIEALEFEKQGKNKTTCVQNEGISVNIPEFPKNILILKEISIDEILKKEMNEQNRKFYLSVSESDQKRLIGTIIGDSLQNLYPE